VAQYLVVSDTTCIKHLIEIRETKILSEQYTKIFIPSAVEVELRDYDILVEQHSSWLVTKPVKNRSLVGIYIATKIPRKDRNLDPGECEAFVLAQELKADILIVDDLPAYQFFEDKFEGEISRTLRVILQAKEQGIIPNVTDIKSKLISNGFFVKPNVWISFLKAAGEF